MRLMRRMANKRFSEHIMRPKIVTSGWLARKIATSAARGRVAVGISIAMHVGKKCRPCNANAASIAAPNVCTSMLGPT
eukprot:121399-Pyramimonas_sp.AAC.1